MYSKVDEVLGTETKLYLDKIPFTEESLRQFFTHVVDSVIEYLEEGKCDSLCNLVVSKTCNPERLNNMIKNVWPLTKVPCIEWKSTSHQEKKLDFYINENRLKEKLTRQVLGGIIIAGWVMDFRDDVMTTHSSVLEFNTELLFSYDEENGYYLLPRFQPFVTTSE